MKIEKAIEILKEQKLFTPLGQACMEAISALEARQSKKIVYDYGLNETRCPTCNTIFGYAYEEDETEDMYYAPYCYECGQCLDWEEDCAN